VEILEKSIEIPTKSNEFAKCSKFKTIFLILDKTVQLAVSIEKFIGEVAELVDRDGLENR